MIKYISQDYTTSKQILAIPDHYVAIAQSIPQDSELAVTEDGRKIVKAGTIFPANDATAIGVIMNDYDITYGDAVVAVIIHGFIRTEKLPQVPADTAKTALKQISFLPLTKLATTISATKESVTVGEAAESIHSIVVSIEGNKFREGAEQLSNWTITGEDTTKVKVDSIKLANEQGTSVIVTTKNTAATVAGNVTIVPKAGATATGDVPTSPITIVTVA